ncbi:MAG: hypothetical protein F6K56_00870 [Moorea sp. SIO3G5]|nr:hypothetical protein [Moorena sp. SIO3G5]
MPVSCLGRAHRFPIPDSRFPIPDSRFPIPDSRFPIPDSLKPKNLYLTKLTTAVWNFQFI